MMIGVGLRGVGQRLVLPAVLSAAAIYYPALPAHLRDGRLVQPVDRRLRPRLRRAYGPYGGVGIGARYNPRTGTYARGAAAYGPYGVARRGQAYNPRTGTYGADATGLERLRQLGHEFGAARRPVGADRARDELPRRATTTA